MLGFQSAKQQMARARGPWNRLSAAHSFSHDPLTRWRQASKHQALLIYMFNHLPYPAVGWASAFFLCCHFQLFNYVGAMFILFIFTVHRPEWHERWWSLNWSCYIRGVRTASHPGKFQLKEISLRVSLSFTPIFFNNQLQSVSVLLLIHSLFNIHFHWLYRFRSSPAVFQSWIEIKPLRSCNT